MYPEILQKAINELNQPKPKLDYIRGLLETLLALAPKAPQPIPFTPITPPVLGRSGKPAIVTKRE